MKAARAPALVIGGAGFIGSNVAERLLAAGAEVIVFDNLSRRGTERNLAWLQSRHGGGLHVRIGDIRDETAVVDVVKQAGAVFHLAAQVAVTVSLADPADDFAVNAKGTLNVLEALRRHAPATPLLFASTNKVYGALSEVPLMLREGRHVPADARLRRVGVNEDQRLDFCTPYGCSKGAADQYVLDYAHSFGLRAAVLRMSCIYGPRQFGTEDQGWVAHFLIRALGGDPVTVYGDGRQVRDILHVDDAVAAYFAVLDHIDELRGRAFNLGGGPQNEVSLRDVLGEIAAITGADIDVRYAPRRTGDQPYYVTDTQRLCRATGWRPSIGWRDGVRDLAAWARANLDRPVVQAYDKRLRA